MRGRGGPRRDDQLSGLERPVREHDRDGSNHGRRYPVRVIAVFTALAIVAVGSVIAQRLFDEQPASFTDSPLDPVPDFVDRIIGYGIDLHDRWETKGIPGAPVAFAPPPVPPTPVPCGTQLCISQGTDDVDPEAITLRVTPRRDITADQAANAYRARIGGLDTVRFVESEIALAGRAARRFDLRSASGLQCIDSDCASWRSIRVFVGWDGGWILDLDMYAQFGVSYEKWGDDAVAAMLSVRPVEATGTASANGTIANHIERDGAADALIRFLEARIAGHDADRWLHADAARGGTRWLYTFLSGCCPEDEEFDLRWYAVMDRTQDEAGSVSFEVMLYCEDDLSTETTETLVMQQQGSEGFLLVDSEIEGRRR